MMGSSVDAAFARAFPAVVNRAADEENRKWPARPVEIPVPNQFRAAIKQRPVKAWRSRFFLVQLFHDTTDTGTFHRLSVQRVEHAAFRTDAVENPISWDELMELKEWCGYGSRWAVEVYPPVDEIVNKARMRHLFIVDRDRLPFAWSGDRSGRSGLSSDEIIRTTDGESDG